MPIKGFSLYLERATAMQGPGASFNIQTWAKRSWAHWNNYSICWNAHFPQANVQKPKQQLKEWKLGLLSYTNNPSFTLRTIAVAPAAWNCKFTLTSFGASVSLYVLLANKLNGPQLSCPDQGHDDALPHFVHSGWECHERFWVLADIQTASVLSVLQPLQPPNECSIYLLDR